MQQMTRLAVLAVGVLLAVVAAGQEIIEFPVGKSVSGMTVGPDGNVWFTECAA